MFLFVSLVISAAKRGINGLILISNNKYGSCDCQKLLRYVLNALLFAVQLMALNTGLKYKFGSSRLVPVLIFIAQSHPKPIPVKRNNLNLLIIIYS